MKNMIFSDVRSLRRVRQVGNKVAPGTAGVEGGKAFVTITGSGDNPAYGKIPPLPGQNVGEGYSVLIRERGGVGLEDNEATVTYTGSYFFDVEDADADTAVEGAKVYLVPATTQPTNKSDAISTGTLTLDDAASGAVEFGTVDFFRGELSATDTVVKIGL